MLLKDRIAARIRANLDWDLLNTSADGDAGIATADAPVSPMPVIRQLMAVPHDDFVHGVYQTVLGRPADAVGLADRVRMLQQGASRAEIIRTIASSDESRSRGLDLTWVQELEQFTSAWVWRGILSHWNKPAKDFIRGLYEVILHRQADPDGLEVYLSQLADGAPRTAIVQSLADSREFHLKGIERDWIPRIPLLEPGYLRAKITEVLEADNVTFVRTLFDAILHRAGTPADIRPFVQTLCHGTRRADVLRTFLTCPEAEHRYDGAQWQASLADVLARAESLSHVPSELEQRLVELLHASDREFAEGIFACLLQRPAQPHEVDHFEQCLADGATRRQVIQDFVTSPEAAGRYDAWDWESGVHATMQGTSVPVAVSSLSQPAADPYFWIHDPNVETFIRSAYHAYLDREPSPKELQMRIRRMRLFPLRSRARLLKALARSWEGQLVARKRIEQPAPSQAIAPSQPTVPSKLEERIIPEMHRELASTRDQVAAVRALAERIPEGISQQLKKIEDTARHPGYARELKADIDRLHRDLQAQQETLSTVQAELTAQQQHSRRAYRQQKSLVGLVRDLQAGQTAEAEARMAQTTHLERVERQQADVLELLAAMRKAVDGLAAPARQARATLSGMVHTPCHHCRICSQELQPRGTITTVQGEVIAYSQCEVCDTVQVPVPPSHPGQPPLVHHSFAETFAGFSLLQALRKAGLPCERVLTCGGSGLLAQMLAEAGVDAWAYAPYHPHPSLDVTRILDRLTPGLERSFDVIVCWEGFERITQPVELGRDLVRTLRPGGCFVVKHHEHDLETQGLEMLPADGSRLIGWTPKGINALGKLLGLTTIARIPGTKATCSLLGARLPEDIAVVIAGVETAWSDCPTLVNVMGSRTVKSTVRLAE